MRYFQIMIIENHIETAGLVSLHISLNAMFQNLVVIVIPSGKICGATGNYGYLVSWSISHKIIKR